MTFRAKPVVKRAHRPSWERQDRRNLYLNLAFAGVIVVAVLILVAAAGASYYGEHFGQVANVDGQSITKDQLRDRVAVDTFRLDHSESLIQNQLNTGRITSAQADSQRQSITTARKALPQSSLDKLVDATLQEQLATKDGITVTDAQVDAQLTVEATIPELRHAWVIAVTPAVSDGATGATDQQKADAKTKAEKALADIKAGQKWEDVAKSVSSDTSTSAQGGDLGWITQDASLDKPLVDALFGLQLNGMTDVIEGTDGTYRIGRVTEIDPSAVDPDYQKKISDAGVSMAAYRAAVKADVVRTALSAKVTADAVNTATLQRQVSEIFISGSPGQPPQDQVEASHILISPGGDPSKVSSLAADDPAWAAAKAEADQIYAELQKDPSQFEELAKTKSSDTVSGAQGGELGWFKATDLVTEFSQAAFAPGLKAGEILAPVKTQYGWHIIRFEGRRADASVRIKDLHDQLVAGADFATLAKANSEGPQAADGGMLGWVAKNQIDQQQEDAIFATPVGSVSDVLSTASGFYLFKVWQEQTRKPDGDQLTTLQNSAFTNWYAAQKKAAAIVEDQLSTTTQ